MINQGTVGKYFRDKEGKLWRLTSYCAEPTATMQRVGGHGIFNKVEGAINSRNLSVFTLLGDEAQEAIIRTIEDLDP